MRAESTYRANQSERSYLGRQPIRAKDQCITDKNNTRRKTYSKYKYNKVSVESFLKTVLNFIWFSGTGHWIKNKDLTFKKILNNIL